MEYKIAPKTHGMQDDHEGLRPDFWQGETGECAIHAHFAYYKIMVTEER